ncbi:DUF924 family protein [Marinicella sediminis]|uniref:DUF924 family protein n=1 Tax=Marinicella sediminis TaxID=1792834 RepID=A0ABV7J6G5_9GAMM|nr:DUF924 family protein [Marinicella sediminis]
MQSQQVIDFWFDELSARQWFTQDSDLDQIIGKRFGKLYQQAVQCELYGWRSTVEGRLAEIIVLDQFSRNMFRGQAAAFAFDPLAVALTQAAIDVGADQELVTQPAKLAFLYMPLMHSESSVIHQQAVKKFSQPGLEDNLAFEYRHKAIIDRFGRYPHRNAILGRESTPEEQQFLTQPGSSF